MDKKEKKYALFCFIALSSRICNAGLICAQAHTMPLPSCSRKIPPHHQHPKWCIGDHWSWLTTADQWDSRRGKYCTTTHQATVVHNYPHQHVYLGLCLCTEVIEIYLRLLSYTHMVVNFIPLMPARRRDSPRVDVELSNPSNVRT